MNNTLLSNLTDHVFIFGFRWWSVPFKILKQNSCLRLKESIPAPLLPVLTSQTSYTRNFSHPHPISEVTANRERAVIHLLR